MDHDEGKNNDGSTGGEFGLNRNLLSDHDFAELMGAEYESNTPATDGLSAERIWKKMVPALKRPASRPFILGFTLAASVIALISLPEIMRNSGPADLRVKGAPIPPALDVYTVADGVFSPIDPARLGPGVVMAFKAKVGTAASSPVVVALAAKIDAGPVQIVTPVQELTGTNEALIEKDSKVYAYQLVEQERNLTFCLFAAPTKEALEKMIAKPQESWAALPASQCRRLSLAKGN